MKTRLLIVLLFCWHLPFAQDIQLDTENNLESLVDQTELNDYDITEYIEQLEVLRNNPINLNQTSQYELGQIPFLSNQQIFSIITYISANPLISIYELQAIPNLDVATIKNILPYVTMDKNINGYYVPLGKLLSKGQHQIYFRYAQQFPIAEDYALQPNKYEGNSSKLYSRYKYFYGNRLSYGLTAEKDAGEAMFRKSNKLGFDFYSAHLYYQSKQYLKIVALGDYQLNIGQGLIAWTGFAGNKGGFIAQLKKTNQTIKAYTSVGENRFLRGAAIMLGGERFHHTYFVSYKKVDASLDTLSDDIQITSLPLSGIHASDADIAKERKAKQTTVGGSWKYIKGTNIIAINSLFQQYNHAIAKKPALYQINELTGKWLLNTSLDYELYAKSYLFFGEIATSFAEKDKGFSTINGVLFSPTKNANMALVHRYYGKNYQSTGFAQAFGEGSRPNNENGIYLAIDLNIHKNWNVSYNQDFYRHPWFKFNIDKPSKGSETRIMVHYKPNKRVHTYLQFRAEVKDGNTRISLDNDKIYLTSKNASYLYEYYQDDFLVNYTSVNQPYLSYSNTLSSSRLSNAKWVSTHKQHKIRWHLNYKFANAWEYRTRIEWGNFSDVINPKSSGMMIFQDIHFKPIMKPYAFNMRLAFFDVNGSNARIYSYENDVLYQFSIPSFNNKGMRYYVNLTLKPFRWCTLWIKYASTKLVSIEQEIPQNHEIKAQVRWEF